MGIERKIFKEEKAYLQADGYYHAPVAVFCDLVRFGCDCAARVYGARVRKRRVYYFRRFGSTYSLVFAGETTDVVFEGVANKEQAKVYIKALTASWTASDCRSAMTFAQNYYDSNRSAVMYLITDKDYEVNDALTLVDVSDKDQNYAFYSFEKSAGGVKGQVISYEADASINIELRGSKNVSDAPEKIGAVSVTAVKGEPADFEISASLGGFAKLELCIVNGDAMQEDNCVVFYDSAVAQDRKVLLISDTGENSDGVYLKNAIRYAGKAEVDLVTPEEYEKQGAAFRFARVRYVRFQRLYARRASHECGGLAHRRRRRQRRGIWSESPRLSARARRNGTGQLFRANL